MTPDKKMGRYYHHPVEVPPKPRQWQYTRDYRNDNARFESKDTGQLWGVSMHAVLGSGKRHTGPVVYDYPHEWQAIAHAEMLNKELDAKGDTV